MQLRALKLFLDSNERFKSGKDKLQLVMAGSVRNEDDERRVESLRRLAVELGVQVPSNCSFLSLYKLTESDSFTSRMSRSPSTFRTRS